MPLLLVQAFLNTYDPDTATDLFLEASSARSWLSSAGLLRPDRELGPDELAFARALRESVRTLVGSEDGQPGDAPALEPLRELVRNHHPRLTVDDRGLIAVENPNHDDVADALFSLVLIVRAAQENGSWTRLKACGNPECRWVFYDRSRNQQGNWCNMAACGNRLKNRRLRARRR
jgi:predicted RNA-binding Zn ribbon-like protein